MRKKLLTIAVVAVCVVLVCNLVQTVVLRQEVSRLRSDMSSQTNNINDNVLDIYSNVKNILEEEANMLAVSDWQYGKIDVGAKTVEIVCTVMPKVYEPGKTKVSIMCNDQEYPLDYSDGQYSACLELGLFDTNKLNMVKMNDSGTVRVQQIDWNIEPRYEVLLQAGAGMAGSESGTQVENGYIWSPKSDVNININSQKEFTIKSIELAEVLDGKEIGRIPVDIGSEGQKGEGAVYSDSVDFVYSLDKDYTIPNGSELDLYVDIVDGNDLRYRCFAACRAVSADGTLDYDIIDEKIMYEFAEPIAIFDKEGNMVYKIDSELFQ